MAAYGVNDDEVVLELEDRIRVFASGRVERYFGSDHVPPSTDADSGVASKDFTISPDVAVRLYLPSSVATSDGNKLPLVVYFHGGGFLLHSAFNALFHRYITSLAARARAIIVSVEYRLAPEHPLPAAYEDSWRALGWVASHVSGGAAEEPWLTNHADFSRLSLGGDSSGANIVHHMAMRAGAEGLPGDARISSIVLVHPYFLGHGKVPSEDSDPEMAENVVKMWRALHPVTTCAVEDDPWINPLAAGAPALDGLPCARVLVCLPETDVLRDRGRAYCEGLRSSGWAGEVEIHEVAGQGHWFHLADLACDDADRQDDAIARFLNP